jgi:hypothetical protein
VTASQIAHRYDLDARRISNWKTKFGSRGVLVPPEVTPHDDNLSMPADRSPFLVLISIARRLAQLLRRRLKAFAAFFFRDHRFFDATVPLMGAPQFMA